MVKGSGYITSQCCGSTEIELGTVYAAEMGISLFSEIDRYMLEDAMVTLSYHLQVKGGSYEEIPMGIFEVSEAKCKAKWLEIKAYDYMLRFEKNFNETAEYYALETDDGLTMNLGVNPLLQIGLDETRRDLITNILNDIAAVNDVPFDSGTIGNPALDLGDVLQFTGGQADAEKISAVTSMSCKIGVKMSLKGVGKNPRLARVKSKNDKNISGLLYQIEAGKIGIHTFTKVSAFTVNDKDVKIISIQFAFSEQNHAQFFGQNRCQNG